MIPLVLTVAGSDSGGGAGIQADLKSIQANGGYGLTVLTSVTAQNTYEVRSRLDLPQELIELQFHTVFDDFPIRAVKTGMLAAGPIVETVARLLREQEIDYLVVDPVMVSKSGYPLLQEEAVDLLHDKLLPQALLVTPNRREAELLSGVSIQNETDAREAGLRILETGCMAVLIKGGQIDAFQCTDYLVTVRGMRTFQAERIQTENTHGTGCTLSAAIATHLAHGRSLEDAVQEAKTYITEAIRHALDIGKGRGPIDHFWFLRKEERPS
jgi:hydroxymethylpyrimidine/phosphomethylpyrimidine kinase